MAVKTEQPHPVLINGYPLEQDLCGCLGKLGVLVYICDREAGIILNGEKLVRWFDWGDFQLLTEDIR